MRVRFVDRSDPMMKRLLPTARYLPLPQPTSTPIEPSRCSLRNFSTSGQGCERIRVSRKMFVDAGQGDAHLVSGRGEVCCYLFVHAMHMLLFIGFTSFHVGAHKLLQKPKFPILKGEVS